jgi:hypothetical protein
MSKEKQTTREELLELEKLAKKVIRKSFHNSLLDFTCQATVSSLDPGEVKYAAMITSPANGVQPITFTFDTFNALKEALKDAETNFNSQKVEIAFHENRINTFKSRIEQHEARKAELEDPNYKEEIPVEEV